MPASDAYDPHDQPYRICASGVGGGEICMKAAGHPADEPHDPDAPVPDEIRGRFQGMGTDATLITRTAARTFASPMSTGDVHHEVDHSPHTMTSSNWCKVCAWAGITPVTFGTLFPEHAPPEREALAAIIRNIYFEERDRPGGTMYTASEKAADAVLGALGYATIDS